MCQMTGNAPLLKTSPAKERGTAPKGGGGVGLQLADASDRADELTAQSEPNPSAPVCALGCLSPRRKPPDAGCLTV